MSLINDALKRAKQAHKSQPPDRPVSVPLQPVEDRGRRAAFPVWAVPLLLVFMMMGSAWFLWQWWHRVQPPRAEVTSPLQSAPVNPPTPVKPLPSGDRPGIAVEGALALTPNPTLPPSRVAAPSGERARASHRVNVNTILVTRTNPALVAAQTAPSRAPGQSSVPPVDESQGTVESNADARGVAAPAPQPSAIASTPVRSVVTPLAPSEVDVRSFPALRLQGVIFRRTKPSALINGETVSEGDSVGEARVVKIERQSVIVEWKGLTNVLRMGGRN